MQQINENHNATITENVVRTVPRKIFAFVRDGRPLDIELDIALPFLDLFDSVEEWGTSRLLRLPSR